LAHFTLPAGAVSIAVAHRTVEEIWFILRGEGQMWRRQGDREEVAELAPEVCLTIPLGCAFQLRAVGPEPLAMVVITMPPWPRPDEAVVVEGKWVPTLAPR
jgi:mannose-6-phosphate isomerase-like protein (cupin superfamily)